MTSVLAKPNIALAVSFVALIIAGCEEPVVTEPARTSRSSVPPESAATEDIPQADLITFTYRIPVKETGDSSAPQWKLAAPQMEGLANPNWIVYDNEYIRAYIRWAITSPTRCGAATYDIVTDTGQVTVNTGMDEMYLGRKFAAVDLVQFLESRCEAKSHNKTVVVDDRDLQEQLRKYPEILKSKRLHWSPWARDTASVISLLGLAKHRPALPYLKKLMRDPDESVRYNAAIALGRLGAEMPEALLELSRLLPEEDLRGLAFDGIKLAGPAATTVLTKTIEKGDIALRRGAISAIPWMPLEDIAPALLAALNHAEPEVRRLAVHAALDMQSRGHDMNREDIGKAIKRRIADPTDLDDTHRVAGIILENMNKLPDSNN